MKDLKEFQDSILFEMIKSLGHDEPLVDAIKYPGRRYHAIFHIITTILHKFPGLIKECVGEQKPQNINRSLAFSLVEEMNMSYKCQKALGFYEKQDNWVGTYRAEGQSIVSKDKGRVAREALKIR